MRNGGSSPLFPGSSIVGCGRVTVTYPPVAQSNANPLANGTAGPGTAAEVSRADHVHPASSATPFAIGAPTTRAVALATAYQATDPSKAALVSINLTSTATISLSGGGTNTADLVIGPTNAIATTGGSALGKYTNSNTGALTIGLNLSTIAANGYTLPLPAGYWFAVRQTAGTVTVVSAFDQSAG